MDMASVHGWWGSGTRYNEELTLLSCSREPISGLHNLEGKASAEDTKNLRRLVVLVWVYCQFEFLGAAVQNFSEEPKGFRDTIVIL